jgi:hypothetical protein
MSDPRITLGLVLLAAHLLGDFVFQTNRTAEQKRHLRVLGFHALAHAVIVYLLLGRWAEWRLPALVLATHGSIDFVKARVSAANARGFFADQAAHVATLAGLAWWLGDAGPPGHWTEVFGRRYDQALLVASGATLCVRAPAIFIGFWVQPYLDEIHRAGRTPAAAKPSGRGLTTGGRVIGQWERALIFIFVGMGQPGAIGFLVAAKSVFRFGELKDYENRMEAEYITIGTLMSFGVAAAISFGTFWLVRS